MSESTCRDTELKLAWSALPTETRRELTGLMARLFVRRHHAAGGADGRREGDDDL